VVDQAWQVVAALVDPVRRALYDHVRRERRPVTREEAAQAVDISRNLAAFHLDKLVEVGVLRARYEAPTDQPRGRGRAPKVYEATGEGVALTMPPRQYELVATILADAVAASPSDAPAAAHRQAAALGHAVGAATHGSGSPSERVARALAGLGYEPRHEGGGIVLDNCPFHALATRHTALICGLNVEFVAGLLEGLGVGPQSAEGEPLCAELLPRTGGCCVRVRPQ
jgi:predicted ArsR family transcriptional regulator